MSKYAAHSDVFFIIIIVIIRIIITRTQFQSLPWL